MREGGCRFEVASGRVGGADTRLQVVNRARKARRRSVQATRAARRVRIVDGRHARLGGEALQVTDERPVEGHIVVEVCLLHLALIGIVLVEVFASRRADLEDDRVVACARRSSK